jgi:hypothetical protein
MHFLPSLVAYHTIVHLLIHTCAIHHCSTEYLPLAKEQSPNPYVQSPISYSPRVPHNTNLRPHNGTSLTLLSKSILRPNSLIQASYIPPAAPFCKCPKYCLLVVFHAAMYFSMQFVKLVCSAEEMDEPGLGIARSKQCSLTFCIREEKVDVSWVMRGESFF